MSRRVDLFVHRPDGGGDYGSDWRCVVQAVTRANGERMAASLEAEGERVRLFTHSRRRGGPDDLRKLRLHHRAGAGASAQL